MKLVFDDLALADLEGIYNWIAKDNAKAAFAVIERVFESVEHLATFPHIGHVGRADGTFEWVVPRLSYQGCRILSCMKFIVTAVRSL